jgi:hypothetical protein
MQWLKRLLRQKKTHSSPDSMTDLRRADPCWCGSGRAYGGCHRKEDRKRMKELGINTAALGRNPFV